MALRLHWVRIRNVINPCCDVPLDRVVGVLECKFFLAYIDVVILLVEALNLGLKEGIRRLCAKYEL